MDKIYVNNPNSKPKGGERGMKRICALTMAMLMLIGPNAMAATQISTEKTVIERWYTYDNGGNFAEQKMVVTTTTNTTDAQGNKSTETTKETITSTFHNGELKIDSRKVDSTTVDSKGNVLSKIGYTDTYTYENGYLKEVTGSGTYEKREYDKEGNLTGSRTGDIIRTFNIMNGEAVLTSQVIEGKVFDKDRNHIKDFRDTTDNSDFDYKGGNSLAKKTKTTSETKDTNISWSDCTYDNWENVDGSWERTITTRKYTYDDQGYITNVTQDKEDKEGERVVITGKTAQGDVARYRERITDYKADFTLLPHGWDIVYENEEWGDRENVLVPGSPPPP